MGLLSKFTGGKTTGKKPTDDVLLIDAMLWMAGADGSFEHDGQLLVCGFFNTLPKFYGKN